MIQIEKILNAPIHLVWLVITNRAHLKQWYFDFSDDFKLVKGQQFDWLAVDNENKQWLHRGKMLEIIEGKKISHSWEYPGYSGTSIVTWELTEINAASTRLNFSHQFVIPFDINEAAFDTKNFIAGWDAIINELLPNYLNKKINI